MSNDVANLNQFYNLPTFMLIKVKFSEADGRRYTYAAHIRHRLQPGDWVVVPTGGYEDVFNQEGGYRSISIGEVTSVTKDMSHIPKTIPLKLAIGKVKGGDVYGKFYKAKMQRAQVTRVV